MPLPREMPIPSATQRNKPTLQNAKMLLYRNLQPTTQPARVVTPMPTTLKCRECGYVLLQHPTVPDLYAFGKRDPRNHRGKAPFYTRLHMELNGMCPGCKRRLPSPSEYKNLLQAEVVDARLGAEAKEALRMRTGGRNAGNFRRNKK